MSALDTKRYDNGKFTVMRRDTAKPRAFHASFDAAEIEAQRLTAKHPNMTFVVLQEVGRVKAAEVASPKRFYDVIRRGDRWFLHLCDETGKPAAEDVPLICETADVAWRNAENWSGHTGYPLLRSWDDVIAEDPDGRTGCADDQAFATVPTRALRVAADNLRREQ